MSSIFHVLQMDRKIEDNTLISNWLSLLLLRHSSELSKMLQGTDGSSKKAESQMCVTSSCSALSPVCIINKTSFLLWQLSSCLTFALHSYSQQSHWCHASHLQRVATKGFLKGLNYDEKSIHLLSFMFHEYPDLLQIFVMIYFTTLHLKSGR